MSQSPQHSIPDELLSAYIDGLVTEEERARIEAAMAADPEIAWQVETLRQTVRLLSELPPVPLPRSFALTQAQVADVLMERQALASVSLPTPAPSSPWSRLFVFLKGGNPVWRNAAAVAAILFLLLMVGDFARVTPLQESTPQYTTANEPAPLIALVQGSAAQESAAQESPEVGALPAMENNDINPVQAVASATKTPAEEAVAAAEAPGAPAVRAAVTAPVPAAPAEVPPEASAGEAVAMEAAPAAETSSEPMVGAASVLPSVEAGTVGSVPANRETVPAPPAAVAVVPASPVAKEAQAEAAAPAEMVAPTLQKPMPTPTAASAEEPAQPEPAALAQVPPAQEEAPASADSQPAQAQEAPEPAPVASQPTGPAIPWEAVRWGLLGLTLLFAFLWWRSRQGSENA